MSDGGARSMEDEEEQIASSLPYLTSTDITTATATTTSTAAASEPMRQSFFSPQKRKRDTSPPEIPETPWRLQYGVSQQQHQGEKGDDQNEEKVEAEVEVDDEDEAPVLSGQVSPGSNKLASQLSDLNLSEKLTTGDLEMDTITMIAAEGPAAKKVKRKGRAEVANGNKVTAAITDMSTEDEGRNGNGNGEDIELEAIDVEQKEKDTGNQKHPPNGFAPRSRPRLRSPPLSKTKYSDASDSGIATVIDESDDIDSDDLEQLGVGYRPTPTQRYVRSQKRMQQIKEYKARISKEAREKRSESRRRRRSFPGLYAPKTTVSSDVAKEGDEGAKRKVVHFNLEPVVVKEMLDFATIPDGLPQLPD